MKDIKVVLQSSTCGGTSHILPFERSKASFDVKSLIDFMNGGPEYTKRRRFINSMVKDDPSTYYDRNNYSRGDSLKEGVKNFIAIHKAFPNFKPESRDFIFMNEMTYSMTSLGNSHGIFLLTVAGQGNEEQVQFWVPKILRFELTGSYCQTELGHGSNVRGLQTTATYDASTEEFIINTPNLQSIKWWPGCLGRVATHVTLYAQLIIDGVEKGINVFIMQIRDENHLPLPGLTIGDLGNKMGDQENDTGFMVIKNVRIPRTNMLMKFNQVTKEGKLISPKIESKVHYFTMITTRVGMIMGAGSKLGMASTIAIRYSAVRNQGFKDSTQGISHLSPENQILDYKIQLYRVLKQLSNAYAIKLCAEMLIKEVEKFTGGSYGTIKSTEGLKELMSTSAGLKSLSTYIACLGIEDLRKSCGGNGYLLSSGISQLCVNYLWQITAEGDYIILGLLTARSLLKAVESVFKGKKLVGVLEYLNVVGTDNFDMNNIHPGSFKKNYTGVQYLEEMFKFRAIKRSCELAQDFAEEVGNGAQYMDAWNLLSNDLIKATYAHCYYVIIKNFILHVNDMKDDKTRAALTRLVVLFACSNFLDDNWGDIISNSDFRDIKKTVNTCLDEIRPDAVSLVDAFDYPDKVLKSTIGRYDGNVYEALFEAATKSTLNQTEPFDGYKEYLRPNLNLELLKRGNKPIQGFGKF